MSPLRRLLFPALLLLVPAVTHAAAGQVLFALGRVEIQRAGQTLAAARGAPVEVGDVISTGPTGLAQVRMQDGALLSLRYGSTLQVEDYRMPAPAPAAVTPVAGATAPPSAAAAGGRSALRLLRGAFRTVTGLIGRTAGDAYSVVTPVATIGIRGTDYSAAYCEGDCGTTADGLYVGVSNGGIEVANDAGTLELDNDQYGYVKDGATAPGRELAPPDVLDAPIPPEEDGEEGDEDGETAAADEAAPDSSFRADSDQTQTVDERSQPEGDYELRPGSGASYAYAGPAAVGAGANGVFANDRAELTGFVDEDGTAPGVYSIGTAQNVNLGVDTATGLRWGRWTGGTAVIAGADADLTTASLHWIYAPSNAPAALPITGTRSYALVGNTDPTDSNGAVGFLGDATLSADFVNQTVSSSVTVGFGDVASGGSLWQASGDGSIQTGTPVFEGGYTSVTVDGLTGPSFGGSFAGFFTSGAAAAGLSFELFNGQTTVNGAAAFAASAPAAGNP